MLFVYGGIAAGLSLGEQGSSPGLDGRQKSSRDLSFLAAGAFFAEGSAPPLWLNRNGRACWKGARQLLGRAARVGPWRDTAGVGDAPPVSPHAGLAHACAPRHFERRLARVGQHICACHHRVRHPDWRHMGLRGAPTVRHRFSASRIQTPAQHELARKAWGSTPWPPCDERKMTVLCAYYVLHVHV